MAAKFFRDVLVGLILFVSCSYILVLNPAILSSAGFPAANVFTATVLAAGFGSFFMGLRAHAPSVVAPGMGLNGFIASFAAVSGLKWQAVLLLMFVVCIIHWTLFVLPGSRKSFLEAIPQHLMDIITSSVAGMILHDAFVVGGILPNGGSVVGFVSSLGSLLAPPYKPIPVFFLVSTLIVAGLYSVARHQAESLLASGRRIASGLFDLAAGLVLLGSVPVAAIAAKSILGPGLPPMELQDHVGFGLLPLGEGFHQAALAVSHDPKLTVPWMVMFVLTALFVLLIDAPGTPYLLLRGTSRSAGGGAADTNGDTDKSKKPSYDVLVQRGFNIEALAGLGSVALQGSPAVCYAESNFAKELGAVRGMPAMVAGVMFLSVLACALLWPAALRNLFESVPLLSLSPLLATIAFSVMIAGFGEPSSVKDPGKGTLDKVQRFLPRALAVGGAFAGSLSIGIALGIVIEFIVSRLRGQQINGLFFALFILSVVTLATILVLTLFQ